MKAYFKPEDRILLLGTSRSPFDGEMKPMCQSYQKIILIPRPDYASRHREFATATNCVSVSSVDAKAVVEGPDFFTIL